MCQGVLNSEKALIHWCEEATESNVPHEGLQGIVWSK